MVNWLGLSGWEWYEDLSFIVFSSYGVISISHFLSVFPYGFGCFTANLYGEYYLEFAFTLVAIPGMISKLVKIFSEKR